MRKQIAMDASVDDGIAKSGWRARLFPKIKIMITSAVGVWIQTLIEVKVDDDGMW